MALRHNGSQFKNVGADPPSILGKKLPLGAHFEGDRTNPRSMTVVFASKVRMNADEFRQHRCCVELKPGESYTCMQCYEEVDPGSSDWYYEHEMASAPAPYYEHDVDTAIHAGITPEQFHFGAGGIAAPLPACETWELNPKAGGDGCELYVMKRFPNSMTVEYRWKGKLANGSMPPPFRPMVHHKISANYYIQAEMNGPPYSAASGAMSNFDVTFKPVEYAEVTWSCPTSSVQDLPMVTPASPAYLTPAASSSKMTEEATTTEDEASLLEYVRHSKGPVTSGCAACDAAPLFWAHETLRGMKYSAQEPGFCKRCSVTGEQRLTNEDGTLHECKKSEGKPDGLGNPVGDGEGEESEAEETAASSPADEEAIPPDKPNLEGPDTGAEEDPWDTDMAEEFDKPGQGESDAPDGEPDQEQEGDPEPLPTPPWKDGGQDQGQGDGEFSDPEDEPDKYVLRDEWMEGRINDGLYLDGKIDKEIKVRSEQARTHLQRQKSLTLKLSQTSDIVADHGRCIKGLTHDARAFEKRLRAVESADVQGIIDAASAGAASEVTINIVRPDGSTHVMPDLHHYQLPLVLKYSAARMHTLMVGPPAVGKSKMARQAAKALELPFYALPGSLNPMTSKTDIVGYMNSTGDYVESVVYLAFTKGGVLFLDEMDNAHPSALAAINDMAAVQPGEMCGFPNGMQERHEDFILIGAANTFGRGPNQQFSGRQRGDAATWDRFNIIETKIDNMLEMTLASRTGAPLKVVDEILRFVRRVRKAAEDKHLPYTITPRATVDMCKAYVAGVDVDEMVEARIRRGTSDDDWAKLTKEVTMLALDDLAT